MNELLLFVRSPQNKFKLHSLNVNLINGRPFTIQLYCLGFHFLTLFCISSYWNIIVEIELQWSSKELILLLFQYVEYFIDRGVLGVNKEVQHLVLEYKGDPVKQNTRSKWDSSQSLVVPVMPPTLVGVCRLMQIYYVLKVWRVYSFLKLLT